MALYHTEKIDTNKLMQLLESPEGSQLKLFAKLLNSNEIANDYFSESPAVWHDDAVGWVRDRFSKQDWYADLNEPEMIAWDYAMMKTLGSKELRSSFRFKRFPIDGMPTILFDAAAESLRQRGEKNSFLRMRPLRFIELPQHIATLDPYDRLYWPEHAVVLPADAALMIDVFNQYESLIDGLVPVDDRLAGELDADGPTAIEDLPHLLTFLSELAKSNSTWFAPVDC
jgi:hypothetical protein